MFNISREGKEVAILYKETGTDETTLGPKTAAENTAVVEPASAQPDALAGIHQTLAALQELFDKQISRNQNQMKMFDALYREMKDYKEGFLLEALHKPIISNLIALHDSFAMLEAQLNSIMAANKSFRTHKKMQQFQQNMENARVELEEVLYRMDVTPYEEHPAKLDRKLHKTLKVIPAATPQQDWQVAEVHKIGFHWREKIFRPEEVTIFRWAPPAETNAAETTANSEKEEGTNE